MSYATVEQFKSLGPNKILPANYNDGYIQSHLDQASALMDSYIAVQYNLPLVAPYDLNLVNCCISLASLSILNARGWNPNNENDALIMERSKDAQSWLSKLSKGSVILITHKKETTSNLLNKPMIFGD